MMTDPTIELSVKDELDWKIERSNEIAAICWQKCEGCEGRGYHRSYWVDEEDAGCDYVLNLPCAACKGKGQIQLHDPWRVEALYDAADDARAALPIQCRVRLTKALALAVNEGVSKPRPSDGASEVKSGEKTYTVLLRRPGCNCIDSHYRRAPMIDGRSACKHQIAVWLVKAAEHKMFDQEPKHYGPGSDMLDGLISVQEADRREVSNV